MACFKKNPQRLRSGAVTGSTFGFRAIAYTNEANGPAIDLSDMGQVGEAADKVKRC